MPKFLTIGQIATGCGGKINRDDFSNLDCGGVCIDSRQVKSGDCFIAIEGENFDGHNFVSQAFEKGAVCAIVKKGFIVSSGNAAIEVADTISALGQLASYYRDLLTAKVIGITGSVGKTSCRDIIAHLLSQRFNCHSASKSFNNHIGLPLTILNAPLDCEVLILELGTNHPGEIEYLTKIAKPDFALITKVAAAHIEYFGSIENIAVEKASIRLGLKSGGKLFVNGSSTELINYLNDNRISYIAYNINDVDYAIDKEGGWFEIDNVRITAPLPGKGSLENVLAAFYLCREFGYYADSFASAVATVKPPQMRLNIIDVGGIKIINDCYNANPQSMMNAIEVLAGFKQGGTRTVAVLGDMLELGDKAEALHRQIGQYAIDKGIDVIFATGKFSDSLTSAAQKQASEQSRHIEIGNFADTDELCSKIRSLIKAGDTVLFKASRSIGLERAVAVIEGG